MSAVRAVVTVEPAVTAETKMETPSPIACPTDFVRHMSEFVKGVEVEHFWVVVLDAKSRPIHTTCVAKGSADNCHVDPREVFRPAIVERGTAFIVCHNHPSGDTKPSNEDLTLTTRIQKGAKLLGLAFLDHFILPTGKFAKDGDYLSFAENRLL